MTCEEYVVERAKVLELENDALKVSLAFMKKEAEKWKSKYCELVDFLKEITQVKSSETYGDYYSISGAVWQDDKMFDLMNSIIKGIEKRKEVKK